MFNIASKLKSDRSLTSVTFQFKSQKKKSKSRYRELAE